MDDIDAAFAALSDDDLDTAFDSVNAIPFAPDHPIVPLSAGAVLAPTAGPIIDIVSDVEDVENAFFQPRQLSSKSSKSKVCRRPN